jgi:protein-tyrosine phosphatase
MDPIVTLPRTLPTALLLAPYRAAFYVFLGARRAFAALRPGHAWRTWVTPELLVGGFLVPADVAELERLGISAVVNTTTELLEPVDTLAAAGIEYLQIPCWDKGAPTLEDADRAVDLIAARIAAGKRVYVHCASGAGRSVAVAMCYLAAHRGKTVDEAYAWIKDKRPRASLNEVQLRFVATFVDSRLHRASRPES